MTWQPLGTGQPPRRFVPPVAHKQATNGGKSSSLWANASEVAAPAPCAVAAGSRAGWLAIASWWLHVLLRLHDAPKA